MQNMAVTVNLKQKRMLIVSYRVILYMDDPVTELLRSVTNWKGWLSEILSPKHCNVLR